MGVLSFQKIVKITDVQDKVNNANTISEMCIEINNNKLRQLILAFTIMQNSY